MTALGLVGAAAVTWLLRLLPVVVLPASRLPAAARRLLPSVGPAVLGSLVVGCVLGGAPGTRPVFVVAAAATAFVAWRTRSPLVTTVVGLGLVGLLQQL